MKKVKIEYYVLLPDDIAVDLISKNAYFPPYQLTVAGKPYDVKMVSSKMEDATEADII